MNTCWLGTEKKKWVPVLGTHILAFLAKQGCLESTAAQFERSALQLYYPKEKRLARTRKIILPSWFSKDSWAPSRGQSTHNFNAMNSHKMVVPRFDHESEMFCSNFFIRKYFFNGLWNTVFRRLRYQKCYTIDKRPKSQILIDAAEKPTFFFIKISSGITQVLNKKGYGNHCLSVAYFYDFQFYEINKKTKGQILINGAEMSMLFIYKNPIWYHWSFK